MVVVAMRRAEERIRRQLADARALTPESAIELSLGRAFDKRRLRGLVDGGAVRLAADDRHFLDPVGWGKYQQRRRRRMLLALSVAVALVGVVFAVTFALR
ncbi:MAG: hypothetical protein R3F56_09330 [Planctomycetota bacterium]